MFYFGEVLDQKSAQVEKMVLLHLLTPTMLCRLFGADMKKRGENRPHTCGGTVLFEERRAGKSLCHDGERRSNALTLTGTADEKHEPERAGFGAGSSSYSYRLGFRRYCAFSAG